MTRLYLLDTNTVIYILKGKSPAARRKLAGLSAESVACISAITEGELLYGLAKSGSEQQKRALEWFLARLNVLAWGREEASAYGILRARQERLGRPLGPLDMQIAAHAIAVGATMVTNDRAFRHVSALSGVENWATDLE